LIGRPDEGRGAPTTLNPQDHSAQASRSGDRVPSGTPPVLAFRSRPFAAARVAHLGAGGWDLVCRKALTFVRGLGNGCGSALTPALSRTRERETPWNAPWLPREKGSAACSRRIRRVPRRKPFSRVRRRVWDEGSKRQTAFHATVPKLSRDRRDVPTLRVLPHVGHHRTRVNEETSSGAGPG
jgi:hypothetical protein